MKVLFVAPRFHTNQIGVIKTLLNNSHEVKFLSNLFGPLEDHSLLTPIILPESKLSMLLRKIFKLESVNLKHYFPNFSDLFSFLKDYKPDILIFRKHGTIYFYLTAIICLIFKIRFIIYEQISPEVLHCAHRGSLKSFFRRKKFHLTLKLFKAKWMSPIPPFFDSNISFPENCYFVPFNVHTDTYYPKSYNSLNILFVGKFQKRKNHHLLVEAINRIKCDHKVNFLFIGEAITKEQINLKLEIEEQVKKLKLNSMVTFIENVNYVQMSNFYKNSNLLVLPSTNEPASISIIEAMSNSTPVICSNTCGNRSYIRNGIDGLYFEDNNLDSLISKINYLLNNKHLLIKMSKSSFERAKSISSNDSFYKSFLSLI